MNENKNKLQRYAMLMGTYMGVFWIAKFALFPLGLSTPFLLFVFMGLTLFVPYMGYKYTRLYRDSVCGGSIGFGNAWMFGFSMYLFASMLTAVAHYVYFRYIDQGFVLGEFEAQLAQLKSLPIEGMQGYISFYEEALAYARTLSPIDLTFERVSNNVFFGALISLPTALIVKRTQNKIPINN